MWIIFSSYLVETRVISKRYPTPSSSGTQVYFTRITFYYTFRIAEKWSPGIAPPPRLQEDIVETRGEGEREGTIAKYLTYENRCMRFSLHRFAITKVVYGIGSNLGQVTTWYVIYTYTIQYIHIHLYALDKKKFPSAVSLFVRRRTNER